MYSQITPKMKRKHHISHSSYQMSFDYLAKFHVINDEDFTPIHKSAQLKLLSMGFSQCCQKINN